MSVFTHSVQSFHSYNKLTQKIDIFMVFLLAALVSCVLSSPARAFTYDEEIPIILSVYNFSEEQSIVYQSGGDDDVSESYHISGQITLLASSYSYDAYIWNVNAFLTETSSYLYTQDIRILFVWHCT